MSTQQTDDELKATCESIVTKVKKFNDAVDCEDPETWILQHVVLDDGLEGFYGEVYFHVLYSSEDEYVKAESEAWKNIVREYRMLEPVDLEQIADQVRFTRNEHYIMATVIRMIGGLDGRRFPIKGRPFHCEKFSANVLYDMMKLDHHKCIETGCDNNVLELRIPIEGSRIKQLSRFCEEHNTCRSLFKCGVKTNYDEKLCFGCYYSTIIMSRFSRDIFMRKMCDEISAWWTEWQQLHKTEPMTELNLDERWPLLAMVTKINATYTNFTSEKRKKAIFQIFELASDAKHSPVYEATSSLETINRVLTANGHIA